jgi:hypothetical protein
MSDNDNDARYLHLIRTDCPLPPGTHVVGYCRDSGGVEQDRSVSQQAETFHEYCVHHNLVLEKVYTDEARRSSNTEKREALQEMLFDLHGTFKRIHDRYKREKIARERPFGVIFWRSNRLGRDRIESTNITTDLRLRGITVVDLVTAANTGNAGIDSVIEAFQSWQDEQLLDEISRNVRRGQAQLVGTRDDDAEFLRYNPGWPSTGGYLGVTPGRAPMGFLRSPIQIGIHKRRKGRAAGEPRIVSRWLPDPETWERCYRAWEMRHNNEGIAEIHDATKLFKNKNGYTAFFSNMIYTGDYEYGGKLYENFVQPMIPREWFEEEKRKIAARAEKLAGRKVKPQYEPRRIGTDYLLSGLVVCGAVDGEEHPMNIESIPADPGKRGEYVFFICTTKKNTRNGYCQAGRISYKALEKAVIDNLMDHVLTVENLRPIADEIAAQLSERNRDADIRIASVEGKLTEVRRSMENLLDTLEQMGYAVHLQQRYDKRKCEEEELLFELDTLKRCYVKPAKIVEITSDLLEQWIADIREVLEGGNRSLAARAIRQFVAKIVVKNGTGTLYYTFPFDGELFMPSVWSVDLRRIKSNKFLLQYPQFLSCKQ